MNIVAIEPLGIDQPIVASLAKDLENAGHTFTYYDSRVTDPAALIQRGKDAEVIIVANLPLSGEVLEGCTKLKLLSVAFTGVDHIDLDTCSRKGIAVSNAAGYSTNAVAELAFGLMISLYRNILACDTRTRTGKTKEGLSGFELKGKKLGIVGTGTIGLRVAEIGKAFGCQLLGYSRTERPEARAMGIEYLPLDELMEKSDIVTLHIPNSPKTTKLISGEKIALMKKSAILINTARGPVVDNPALAQALKTGAIAGAGLDVFDSEPPIPSDDPLIDAPNTVLTPHEAFATKEALVERAEIVFDNIAQWIKGTPINVIL